LVDWYVIGKDLLIGIVLIIVGALLHRFYRSINRWLKLTRPVSKILGTLASTNNIIIVSPKLYSTQRSLLKDPSNPAHNILWNRNFALFAEGDSKAVMHLYRFLVALGKKKGIEIKSDTELSGVEQEQELICIGAGSNDLTKNFQRTERPRIEFGQSTQHRVQLFGLDIRDRQTNEVWTATAADDFGLIIRWKNPRNQNSDIMIIAGLGPSGTAAAAYYLSNKWKEIYKHLKAHNAFNKNYEVLIKTSQTDHTHVDFIKIVTD
jgi:hypothetical protein